METKRFKSRRLLIAALGGAGASTLLGKKWVKPVIESVVLPAHARTSEQELLCSDQLRISGITLNCADSGSVDTQRVYNIIDDEGECPELREVNEIGGGFPPDDVVVRFFANAGSQVEVALTIIDVESGQLEGASAVAACTGGDFFIVSSKTELLFRASSGAPWRANFTMSGVAPPPLNSMLPASGSVTVTDIVFTPDV